MTRRGLVRLFWAGVLALAAWPVARFVAWREPATRTVVFRPEELKAGAVIYKEEVFLVPAGAAGEPRLALSARCSHLGCLVAWSPVQGEFRCPCHHSVYGARGQRLAGPTERGLAKLPAEILEDGSLAVQAPV